MAEISILWIALFGGGIAALFVWRGARRQHLTAPKLDHCQHSAETPIATRADDATEASALDQAFLDNAYCLDGRMALTMYLIVRAQQNGRQMPGHDLRMRSGRRGYISRQNGLLS